MNIFEIKQNKKLISTEEFENNILILYLNTKYRIKKKVLKNIFIQSHSIEEYRKLLSAAASKSLFNFGHRYDESSFDIGNIYEINEVRKLLKMPEF